MMREDIRSGIYDPLRWRGQDIAIRYFDTQPWQPVDLQEDPPDFFTGADLLEILTR